MRLMVSWDAGCSYGKVAEGDSLLRLRREARQYDEQGLRWAIEDDEGNIFAIGKIQRDILAFVNRLNAPSTEKAS